MRDLLARRVAGFGTSIFTEITALAIQHNAVNLGQGFPDFAGPEFVKRAAQEAIAADRNQYAPAPGLPRLRQAIAAQWQRDTGQGIDWVSEVTVTSGATEALCDTMLALIDPGDRAIVFEPTYDAYVPDITMAGGQPIAVTLNPPDDAHAAWWFDDDELRAAFTQNPKLILLNTPHNPTGKVFTEAELALIASLCQEHDVIAVCDEVYDRMTYGVARHVRLATLPGMWDRTLTLNSTGKTFSVTGWKIGYAIGPAHLTHALRQAHQWVTFATATPLQDAAAAALEHALVGDYYDELAREYDERRALLVEILQAAGLPTLPVEGSYFVNCDIGAFGYRDGNAFCRFLTAEIGVAAIPVSAFYAQPAEAPALARFCFAKSHATLRAAGEKLLTLRAKVRGEYV